MPPNRFGYPSSYSTPLPARAPSAAVDLPADMAALAEQIVETQTRRRAAERHAMARAVLASAVANPHVMAEMGQAAASPAELAANLADLAVSLADATLARLDRTEG